MTDYYIERAENRRYDRNHYNRARSKSYNFKLIVMILIFIFSIFISVFSIKKHAYANENSNNSIKQFKSVVIYCGDSIDSISDNYEDYGYTSKNSFAREICSINGLSNDCMLIAGNYIIIPYFESI